LLTSKIIKLFINLIYELIISGFMRRIVFQDQWICGAQFAWAVCCKTSFWLLLFVFVYFSRS